MKSDARPTPWIAILGRTGEEKGEEWTEQAYRRMRGGGFSIDNRPLNRLKMGRGRLTQGKSATFTR